MADQDIKDIWFSAIGRASNYQTMVFYAGTGQDTFEFNFSGGYINREDIKAFMVEDTTRERIDLTLTFTNTNTVKTNRTVPKNWTVCIYRDTPKSMPLAKFVDGAIINATNLDRNAKQAVFAVSEMVDRFDSTVEQVDTALVKVSEALVTSAEAVKTANAADKKADTAITTADGAVVTANAASKNADTAIKTANAASTTATGAVQTANAAKATADGLNAQIVAANKTAGEAKSIAQGIDAKATTALADAAAAVKTANEAETTANGIDAKATQAQKDAANALLAVDVAKELADRVQDYPSAINVRWRGMHTIKSIRVEPANLNDSAYFGQMSVSKYLDGSRLAFYAGTPEEPAPDYAIDIINSQKDPKIRLNYNVDVDKSLVVAGDVNMRGIATVQGKFYGNGDAEFAKQVRAKAAIFTESGTMGLDYNGRRHFRFYAGNGKEDGVIYKDVGKPFIIMHQGPNTGGSLTLGITGDLALNGTDTNIYGVGNIEFTTRSGVKNAHWLRRRGDAGADNFMFGVGGTEMVNFQYRASGGNIALFQNEVRAGGTSMADNFLTHGGARFYHDGDITGPAWSAQGIYAAAYQVASNRDRANDAWNKAHDAQNGRMASIRRGGQQYMQTGAQGSWEAPTGCFLTGRNNAVPDGRAMGFYYRGLQRYVPQSGWIDCDGDA